MEAGSSRMLPAIEIWLILLCELLALADWWKNFMLRFPSFSQEILDLCFQWISWALGASWRADLADKRSSLTASEGTESKCNCLCRYWAFTSWMFWWMRPKVVLLRSLKVCFKDLSFWARMNWGSPFKFVFTSQLVLTTSWKDGWSNHLFSNLKGAFWGWDRIFMVQEDWTVV